MRKIFFLYFISLSFLIFSSCSKTEQEKDLEKIKDLEIQIKKDNTLDKKLALKLITVYDEFQKKYANDTISAIYIFKAGEIAMNTDLNGQAIYYFNKIERNYKKFNAYPLSIFYQALLYEKLEKKEDAKIYYQKFINKYPKNKLSDDARMAIENLDLSLEELVKKFQKQEKNNL